MHMDGEQPEPAGLAGTISGSTFRWLSRLFGTASVVILLKHGLDVGFGPALSLVFDYYGIVIEFVLGWAEPYLKEAIAFFRHLLGIDIDLYPHWKHVFVLMGIYFWSSARTSFAANRPVGGVFDTIWGLIVALAASLASGIVFFDTVANISTANFLIAAIPVVGVTIFDIGGYAWSATFDRERGITWSEAFVHWIFYAFARLAAALLVLTIGFQLPFVRDLPIPGLVLLTLLVVLAAFYWIGRGAWDADAMRGDEDTWWYAFTHAGTTFRGLLMLEVMIGAVGMFLLNAGLNLVGL